MDRHISIPTLRRLPVYYQIVSQALESGEEYISSNTIAKILEVDDTQVRKDIAAIGYYGKPRSGFEIKSFKIHLEDFLDLKTKRQAFLIGAGNLGVALAKYGGFDKFGLEIAALFDNDPHKIDLKIGDKQVYPIYKLHELVKEMNVEIIVLAVPAESAQEVVDFAINAGIKAIWNFAPLNPKVPDGILKWNQDLAANFITLSLLLSQNKIITESISL